MLQQDKIDDNLCLGSGPRRDENFVASLGL